MPRLSIGRLAIAALVAGAADLAAASAGAQSIEPRAYSPAPVGVNFVILAYGDSSGGLSFDSSVPLKDARLQVQGPILAYARSLDLAGRLAKFDVILPAGRMSGAADYNGQQVRRDVTGMQDPLVRLSVNLYGAPAASAAQFRLRQQSAVVGASLQVSIPLGEYDDRRLVNLGANRWAFRPEVGGSKTLGPWTLESAIGATVYTTNADFFGGLRRHQDPIYSWRANLIYNLRSGAWASIDTTYYTGGATTLNGAGEHDLQRNWRVGATVALPVTSRTSLKLNASRGVSARTGNNYDLVGVALQYRWGGGL